MMRRAQSAAGGCGLAFAERGLTLASVLRPRGRAAQPGVPVRAAHLPLEGATLSTSVTGSCRALRRSDNEPPLPARGLAGRGRTAWDQAIEVRDPLIMPIKTYPFFDPVRGDPRYGALLRWMNLADWRFAMIPRDRGTARPR